MTVLPVPPSHGNANWGGPGVQAQSGAAVWRLRQLKHVSFVARKATAYQGSA